MSWKLKVNLKNRLAAESGGAVSRRGGRLRICLVYPNRYRIAMSNLGFMAVHSLINSCPDMLCERSFLPDPDELREYEQSRTPLLSLETQQPVGDFDVIAFSISFESDYLNLPLVFKLAGLPCYSRERNERQPLVMAGGAALFLNPEPVADFLDLVCLGEAEVFLNELLTALGDGISLPRVELLQQLSAIPGVYVPSRRRPGDGSTVARQYLQGLDGSPVTTTISTPETEFGDLHLVELSRGCPRGCRFCAAGYIYLPYRQRSLETIREQVLGAIARQRK
ncbi:MAG TPA: radical SAM protein, partial [Geobacteraceae bacterium]|nr:radical SAM protein [Geobacteraceae bacterium]